MIVRLSRVAVVVVLALVVGCGQVDPTPTDLAVGVLLPLTGSQSSYGETGQAALNLAVTDINTFFEQTEANLQFQLLTANTRSDPQTAFDELNNLSAAGVSIVIGPWSSEELAMLQPLARRLGVLLISPAAGLPSLAIADDTVFRLSPEDTQQAEALASLWRARDIEATALLVRNGPWGDEFADVLSERFTDHGGVIVGTVRYEPSSTGGNDYRDELDSLSTTVSDAMEDFGTNGVAISLLSYDEGIQIFKQAEDDATLRKVPWFGSDGFALNGDLIGDTRALAVAAEVQYTAPVFAGDEVDPLRLAAVRDPLEEELGRRADGFALAAYDAAWLAALTLSEVGASAGLDALQGALPTVADFYNGATGLIRLDNAGDRVGSAYDFWTLVDSNGTVTWERTAAFADDMGVTFPE